MIGYVSLLQLGVLFGVFVLFIKQIYYIFLGSPFYNHYKNNYLETYFPCTKTDNKTKEVFISFFYLLGK